MSNSMTSVSREIATLRRTMKAMDRSLRRLGPKLQMAVNSARKSTPGRAGRKLRLSPKRRAQLKLQGLYIGYVRQLRPKQKAEVRAILEQKGMGAAVARAKRVARG